MMKATFTSNGSISCVSCIWYSPTWKRCCFVHGFVVASRSSAIVRRLASALALSLAARCAASLCPCDALTRAASRPAARPAAPAASSCQNAVRTARSLSEQVWELHKPG